MAVDGLEDCLDPDCCQTVSCSSAAFCQTAADPIAILQRTPKIYSMASFYDSKKFLIERDDSEGVQVPADPNIFDPK